MPPAFPWREKMKHKDFHISASAATAVFPRVGPESQVAIDFPDKLAPTLKMEVL